MAHRFCAFALITLQACGGDVLPPSAPSCVISGRWESPLLADGSRLHLTTGIDGNFILENTSPSSVRRFSQGALSGECASISGKASSGTLGDWTGSLSAESASVALKDGRFSLAPVAP